MRILNQEESIKLMYQINFDINTKVKSRTEEENRQVWQRGWGELVTKTTTDCLYPQYYSKYKYARYQGQYIEVDDKFEIEMGNKLKHRLFTDNILSKTFIEFGCGTGHNLVKVKRMFPHLRVIGTDWVDSAGELVTKQDIEFHKFDMLHPTDNLDLDWAKTTVFTMHSMEQLGKKWSSFFEYLVDKKPELVIHIEPIHELYDITKTYDFLAWMYHYKKFYLEGYLTHLKQDTRINLLDVNKAEFGSMYHDGYSSIIWDIK